MPRESIRPTSVLVPGRMVVTAGHPLCVGPAGAAPIVERPAAPTVEVIQENGIIRALDITCVCGEKIRVSCVYDS